MEDNLSKATLRAPGATRGLGTHVTSARHVTAGGRDSSFIKQNEALLLPGFGLRISRTTGNMVLGSRRTVSRCSRSGMTYPAPLSAAGSARRLWSSCSPGAGGTETLLHDALGATQSTGSLGPSIQPLLFLTCPLERNLSNMFTSRDPA